MYLADKWKDYELLDCGDGQRLERWGSFNLVRPDPQAIWEKSNPKMWKNAHGKYTRSNTGGGSWDKKQLPESWTINYGDLKFGIKPMFPEDACLQMELLGHSFFVFSNADTEEVNVVYKRKDGSFGLIEPEFS